MKRIAEKTLRTFLPGALALAALGCGEEVITLGLVVPLTGEHSIYGEANHNGARLALAEIQSDGYPLAITLAVEDSTSDPARATRLLDELFAAGAFAALGGSVSDEALEMIAVADKYDRVLLSPSATSPGLTGQSPNFYRIAPSDLTEGNKMADFAFRQLDVATVVVVAEGRTYARGIQEAFSAAFEAHGGAVLEAIDLPPEPSDLGGLVGRVATLAPDAVYLAAYEQGISAMIEELRRQGFAGRILTTHAFSSPAAIARVGEAAAGVILTQSVFEPDSDHAHVKKFVNAYRERYGEEPDLFAAEGYDAMKVMATALAARHAIASELPRGLRDEIQEFPGVTGSIQFDEKGDVTKFPRVYVIGEDLLLYDLAQQMEQQKQRARQRQKELQERLQKLRESAAEIVNGS